MKMTRKLDTLRSKLGVKQTRSALPFHEATNTTRVVDDPSPLPPPSSSSSSSKTRPSPLRVRKRTDSDCTIVPVATTSKGGSPERPTKKRRDNEPDYPEIPDEDISPLPLHHTSPVSSPECSPAVQLDSDSGDDDVSRYGRHSVGVKRSPPPPPPVLPPIFRRPIGLVSSFPPRRTLSSVLEIRLAHSNPVVWDLGLPSASSSAEDHFVIAIQLRFRSWDLPDWADSPPQELFLRVSSLAYPRFQVSSSRRAYQVSYVRSPLHPFRVSSDTMDLCKLKGWRYKHGCWMFDLGWKVNSGLFTESLTTRRFRIEAEIKSCSAIVMARERDVHVTNFRSGREIEGLVESSQVVV